MLQLHERPVAGKIPLVAVPIEVTAADIQKADLLLAAIYDANLYAERLGMKLDYVAAALRRQFISYDSAINWLSDLDLLNYVLRPDFSYEAVQ
jgi:hypothetical protein